MKKITLAILGMQLLAEGKVALITKATPENPSKNGVHVLSEGQIRRISIRTLGVYNPVALKHFVELSNGNAKLTIEAEECKAGEAFDKADGSKGTYTKDWTKYQNHDIKLASVANVKLAEMSIAASFGAYVNELSGAKPVAPVAQAEKAEDVQP